MKYCTRCGKENDDNSLFCSNCGTSFNSVNTRTVEPKKSTLKLIAYVFMIIAIVSTIVGAIIMIASSFIAKEALLQEVGSNPTREELIAINLAFAIYIFLGILMLVSLIWLSYFAVKIRKAYSNPNVELSVAFKVCVLLFGGLISGILLLCDN